MFNTSIVLPLYAVTISPGLCAFPPGIFSVDPIAKIIFNLGFNSATAFITPITVELPHISNFISSILAEGLIEIPPESNVRPLPTKAIGLSPFFPPLYSTRINLAGSCAPIATP